MKNTANIFIDTQALSAKNFADMAIGLVDSDDVVIQYEYLDGSISIESSMERDITLITDVMVPYITKGVRTVNGKCSVFHEKAWITVPEDSGVFYINNTFNETQSRTVGYFGKFESAIVALQECNDWYRDKGTGEIWFRPYGINRKEVLVFKK